jgi:uncharacterized protein
LLKNTFLHISGIGPKKEEQLWRAGITSWDDVAATNPDFPLSPPWVTHVRKLVYDSVAHLLDRDVSYFASRLPSHLHWRLFPEFRSDMAYLDIETTGRDGAFDDITVIGLYDGCRVYHYIMGENLHEFEEAIHRYKVLVTFNGRCFDVPFIERFFHTRLEHGHIDLRFVLRSLGIRSGLKRCESQLGIDRGNLKDVDGFMAVLLWRDYLQTGDRKALDTLLAYNTRDIVNLEALLIMAYNMKLRETPFFKSHALALPSPPIIAFQEDVTVIERIKDRARAVSRFL